MREDTILKEVLRTYCNVNARSARWPGNIRVYLDKDPKRLAQFKRELDDAIENGTVSMKEYKRLTEEVFDTHEEYIASLKEFRDELFGDSSG